MSKYRVITAETAEKLLKCFSNSDEFVDFFNGLDAMSKEVDFCRQKWERAQLDQGPLIRFEQIVHFTAFCFEHIELVHQLVSVINFRNMTEDEIKDLDKK